MGANPEQGPISGGREAPLLERERELGEIHRALSAAAHRTGAAVLIESRAGRGKSRLLQAAGDLATDRGMKVLEASASELESNYAFALALKLFDRRRLTQLSGEWAGPAAAPARSATEMLELGAAQMLAPADEREHRMIRGLFALTTSLSLLDPHGSTSSPLVLLVDDLQWADRESMRFLAYLADRVRDLAVVLVATVRSGESVRDDAALRSLQRASSGSRMRLAPLSAVAIGQLVDTQLPEAEPGFASACARLTLGNPSFLTELLTYVRTERLPATVSTAERLEIFVPDAIVSSVLGRLEPLPGSTRELLQAMVVLGDSVSLHEAAGLARLSMDEAVRAADYLAQIYILRPDDQLTFVHPIARSAVRASLSPLKLAYAHRRAAALLDQQGAPPGAVAAHLANTPPENNARAARALGIAARDELARGQPRAAAALFARAIAERPLDDERADLLVDLARSRLLAGIPDAAAPLREAAQLIDEPQRSADLALLEAEALYRDGRFEAAANSAENVLSGTNVHANSLRGELEAAYVRAGALVPRPMEHLAVRRARLTDMPSGEINQSRRLAIASLAVRDSVLCEHRRSVRRLVEVAWSDDALLRSSTGEFQGWHVLPAALLFADELERAEEISAAALAIANERGSEALRAIIRYGRVWPLYEQGQIDDAAAEAQIMLDSGPCLVQSLFRTAHGALASCHLQRGDLESAERAIARIEEPDVKRSCRYPFLLDVRAQLRLAQHRPQEALDDALHAAQELESHVPGASPGVVPWRSTAATAHLALGQAGRASTLAGEELEIAQRAGVTRIVVRDLRVLGLASRGSAGLARLREAVKIGARHPARLEYMHALVDLGAALRRANQRSAAREPLSTAARLCHRGGAVALAARAETELAATGVRASSKMRSGVSALTPSERRVADLAAEGLTSRQMSETLFVTPKTIEYHLRHIYQKLDVNSREGLAGIFETGSSDLRRASHTP